MMKQNQKQASKVLTAIDFGLDAIRIAVLSRYHDSDRWIIIRKGSCLLEQGLWGDSIQHGEELYASLMKAIRASGITTRSALVCMPRTLVTLRIAALPTAPPEEMKQMLSFEAQQYILYPMEEVALGYHVIGPVEDQVDGAAMSRVLLASVRIDLATQLIEICRRAGIRTLNLTVSSAALAELIREEIQPTAIVSVSSSGIDMAAASQGEILFTRGVMLDSAQQKDRLLEEVMRSITACTNELHFRTLSRLILGGPPSQLRDEVQSELTRSLSIPVEAISSLIVPPGDPEAAGYLPLLGMALQQDADSIAPINLIPSQRTEQTERRNRQLKLNTAAIIATAAILSAIWLGVNAFQRSAKMHQEMISANLKLQDFDKRRLNPRQSLQEQTASLLSAVNSGLHRNYPSIDVLAAVSSVMPAGNQVWLNQLSFGQNGVITVQGKAMNPGAVTALLVALQHSHYFNQVKLSFLGDVQETVNAPNPPPQLPPMPVIPNSFAPPGAAIHPAAISGQTPGAVMPPRAAAQQAAQPNVQSSVTAKSSTVVRTGFAITCKANMNEGLMIPAALQSSSDSPTNQRNSHANS